MFVLNSDALKSTVVVLFDMKTGEPQHLTIAGWAASSYVGQPEVVPLILTSDGLVNARAYPSFVGVYDTKVIHSDRRIAQECKSAYERWQRRAVQEVSVAQTASNI